MAFFLQPDSNGFPSKPQEAAVERHCFFFYSIQSSPRVMEGFQETIVGIEQRVTWSCANKCFCSLSRMLTARRNPEGHSWDCLHALKLRKPEAKQWKIRALVFDMVSPAGPPRHWFCETLQTAHTVRFSRFVLQVHFLLQFIRLGRPGQQNKQLY